MPLTFPSHAAAVLPLKLRWPRRFDGVALVIGSAAPDFTKSIHPHLDMLAHTWPGVLLFCVPVTVALAALTRRAAPAVVGHLPDGGRLSSWFAPRDYAVLAAHRHRWHIAVFSALLGAGSHRLWDTLTHASMDGGAISFAWLSGEAFAGQEWWRVLHHGSSLFGGLAVVLMALHIGRTRWLARSGDPLVRVPPRPRLFWSATAAVWLPGVAVQPFLPWVDQPQVLVVRLLEVCCLGLLAGAAAVHLSNRGSSTPVPAAAGIRVQDRGKRR